MVSTHVDIEQAEWTSGTPFYGPAAIYEGKDIVQLKVLSDRRHEGGGGIAWLAKFSPPPGKLIKIVATALSAALGTLLMAFLANYPIALAPGMGLNAFFAYSVCLGAKVPWPTALGLVFWSGVLFVLLTVTGARAVIVRAVPRVLVLGGAVGIGLFIGYLAHRPPPRRNWWD